MTELYRCPDSEVRTTSRQPQCELRNQRDTSNFMIPVPLLNPKFAKVLAAWCARTSGSRHQCPDSEVRPTSRQPQCELRNQRDTSNFMIPVPLLNPKFAKVLAAWCARTSGSRHWFDSMGNRLASIVPLVGRVAQGHSRLPLQLIGRHPGGSRCRPGLLCGFHLWILEHDPEKWAPVFGKDHAPTRS
jgi:hypothetical protein